MLLACGHGLCGIPHSSSRHIAFPAQNVPSVCAVCEKRFALAGAVSRPRGQNVPSKSAIKPGKLAGVHQVRGPEHRVHYRTRRAGDRVVAGAGKRAQAHTDPHALQGAWRAPAADVHFRLQRLPSHGPGAIRPALARTRTRCFVVQHALYAQRCTA
eukprot:3709347-Rhodomonas_salina.3